MTETNDASDIPEQVSREAHLRVKGERDAARQELDKAKAALVDANLMFEAQGFLTGKVKDPVTAAKMVLPELRSFESADDRAARLEAAVPLFAPLEQASPNPTPKDSDAVVPDAPPTPSFMQPSPASDGAAPTQPKLTMRSPEVRELVKQGRDAEVKQMIARGEIEMHPLNRTYQAQHAESG